MNSIESIELRGELASLSTELQDRVTNALESGRVLFLPHCGFCVTESERKLLSPAVVNKSKNVSYDPRSGALGGTTLTGRDAEMLRDVIARFSNFAQELLLRLIPRYKDGFILARTSFRPVEIEGRVTSWRKDDTRLHVDSFPSSPTQGKRILRVFANVNPEGRSRVWRIGEPFEQMAKRFLPLVKRPLPGSAAVLKLLGVTKSKRSEYDHIMLQFHDLMKANGCYQKEAEQIEHEFPAGATWIAFTDQVSHAATRGQYQFEQTFLVPVARLQNEQSSPLQTLERLVGRALV
jgi:hypothetical protein